MSLKCLTLNFRQYFKEVASGDGVAVLEAFGMTQYEQGASSL